MDLTDADYRGMVERSHEAMFRTTLDGRLLMTNPATATILGYDDVDTFRAEVGHDVAALYVDQREREALVRRLRERGEVTDHVVRLRRRDGDVAEIAYWAHLLRDDAGEPVAIEGRGLDVTEQRRAARAVARRDRILGGVAYATRRFVEDGYRPDAVTDVIAALGEAAIADRVFLFEDFRRPDGIVVTRYVHEWCAPGVPATIGLPEFHEVAYVDEGFEDWLLTFDEGDPIVVRRDELSDPQRALIDLAEVEALVAVPVRTHGQVFGFMGFGYVRPDAVLSTPEVDALGAAASALGVAIGRHRADEAAQRSRAYLEAVRAAASAANHCETFDAAVAVGLRAVCEAAGWPLGHVYRVTDDRCVPGDVWFVAEPEVHAPFVELTRTSTLGIGQGLPGRVVRRREPVWIEDVTQDAGDVRARTADELGVRAAFAVPVVVEDRVVEVLEFHSDRAIARDDDLIAVARDVAEQLARIHERTRYLARVEASNAELERFAYVASHDLQEPLRKVASCCELLDDEYGDRLDDEGREFLGYAVDGARRMRRLIQDLLTYSRIHQPSDELSPVDLDGVVNEVLRSLSVTIEESGAHIEVAPLPPVMGHRGQLVQLFQNLLGNALKFAGETSPLIRVGARNDEGTVTVDVTDNGIGIDARYSERVFEVFERLHTRDSYEGTGIGLAICRRIAVQHGGSLWFDSVPGQGSTFHVQLHAVPVAASPN